MRLALFSLFVALALLYNVAAAPLDEQSEDDEFQSRTYTSLKNFFQPLFNWFRTELPAKTPSDLATDIKESAKGIQEWADNSQVIQTTKNAFQPVQNWFTDTANTLKDKTFRDMFQDTKEVAVNVDRNVGDWINEKVDTKLE